MAERRMFAKTIIDSDAFLDMPMSAQCLYFHLCMRADDEGFVNNPKKIQRMIGASEDDAKVLVGKKFIIPFDSGVIVIKHWKIHNYIRGDRLKETEYLEERNLLDVKDNGAYTLIADAKDTKLSASEERKLAYQNSTLPYSFDYKIRHAFDGEMCPVCGYPMLYVENGVHRPTIQHNLPISKGGKHELGNISVICHNCNVSIRDKETGSLNADKVIEKWDDICNGGEWLKLGCQPSDKCQSDVSIGKDRLGKDSIGNKEKINKREKLKRNQIPPTVDMVKAYCKERGNNVDAEMFYDFYESKGWMVGKNKMKDWQSAVRTWERSNKNETPNTPNQEKIEEGRRAQEEAERQMEEQHKEEMSRFMAEHPELMENMGL